MSFLLYNLNICAVWLVCAQSSTFQQPVVIRKQFQSISTIADYDGPLNNVYTSSSHIFPYYDTAIANGYSEFSPTFTFVKMSSVNRMCYSNINTTIDNKNVYYYYSGDLQQPIFASLHDTLSSRRHIRHKRIVQQTSSNLWFGGRDVVATAHYDNVNNVYMQLKGSKRFRLLPPSSLYSVALHGRHHPYACQSRVADLATGVRFVDRVDLRVLDGYLNYTLNSHQSTIVTHDTDAFNNAQQLDNRYEEYKEHLIDVVLYPGDMLLIPPFWLHEATALDCSMSISHWWDASQMSVMDDVYTLPLPIESSWAKLTTLSTMFIFIDRLIQSIVTEIQSAIQSLSDSMQECVVGTNDIDVCNITTNGGYDMKGRIAKLLIDRYISDYILYNHTLHSQHYSNNNSDATVDMVDNRILTDYQMLYNMTIHITQHDTPLLTKIDDYIHTKYTPLFMHGFVHSDNVSEKLSDILHNWNDSYVTESNNILFPHKSNNNSSDSNSHLNEDMDVLLNRIAILHIKLCDYVEDIFLFISTTTSSTISSIENESNSIENHELSELPRAVLYLFQFLSYHLSGDKNM